MQHESRRQCETTRSEGRPDLDRAARNPPADRGRIASIFEDRSRQAAPVVLEHLTPVHVADFLQAEFCIQAKRIMQSSKQRINQQMSETNFFINCLTHVRSSKDNSISGPFAMNGDERRMARLTGLTLGGVLVLAMVLNAFAI
jgi:hypothetical protein